MLSEATAAEKALIVIKGGQHWPDTDTRVRGYIDVWWILHDGGDSSPPFQRYLHAI
jgi:hypothetical protein